MYKSDYGGTSAKTTKTMGEALNVHITIQFGEGKSNFARYTLNVLWYGRLDVICFTPASDGVVNVVEKFLI